MALATKSKEREVVKWGSRWGRWDNLLELSRFALLVVEVFNFLCFAFYFKEKSEIWSFVWKCWHLS